MKCSRFIGDVKFSFWVFFLFGIVMVCSSIWLLLGVKLQNFLKKVLQCLNLVFLVLLVKCLNVLSDMMWLIGLLNFFQFWICIFFWWGLLILLNIVLLWVYWFLFRVKLMMLMLYLVIVCCMVEFQLQLMLSSVMLGLRFSLFSVSLCFVYCVFFSVILGCLKQVQLYVIDGLSQSLKNLFDLLQWD